MKDGDTYQQVCQRKFVARLGGNVAEDFTRLSFAKDWGGIVVSNIERKIM